mmetsp:Transcript_18979/g.40852  ORF Transcript_18979/g.40852 Transcript_18979/m.40852 type:complete len:226 (-) Transcript_18979:1705-2382(-)
MSFVAHARVAPRGVNVAALLVFVCFRPSLRACKSTLVLAAPSASQAAFGLSELPTRPEPLSTAAGGPTGCCRLLEPVLDGGDVPLVALGIPFALPTALLLPPVVEGAVWPLGKDAPDRDAAALEVGPARGALVTPGALAPPPEAAVAVESGFPWPWPTKPEPGGERGPLVLVEGEDPDEGLTTGLGLVVEVLLREGGLRVLFAVPGLLSSCLQSSTDRERWGKGR